MTWQDLVFAAGTLVFIAALIPMVLAKQPPPLASSLSTGGVLAIFALCYITLDLKYAAATTAGSSALWLTLAVQKVRGA